MREDFFNRAKLYFGQYYDEFVLKLKEETKHGFYINHIKGDVNEILNMCDFDYKQSELNELSYYTNKDNIGKTIAYELGLIYPQDPESTFFITKVNKKDVNIVVDMCAAPGGKSIDAINKYPNSLFICNDVNYKRTTILSSNLERLGLNNTIVTNKDLDTLSNILEGNADIVILDAPCSGEGMIRKYPEILDNYDVNNIIELSKIQEKLLDNAYKMCNKDSIIIYSTCTYAFEEDENQIINFLNKHDDCELIKIGYDLNISKLDGTVKLSPLNNTEGQFIALIKRNSINVSNKIKCLKEAKNKVVENFIKDNIIIDNYHLFSKNDFYYISNNEPLDLGSNVLRNGILLGELKKERFEPSHSLYRSSLLFRNKYNLYYEEYIKYISGSELKLDLKDGYYQLTYINFPIGYGKCAKGILKNKYPKGLRRMIQ